MADDPTQTEQDDPATGDPNQLGDPGKKALDAERARAKAAEKRAKDAETRLKEIEDAEKSELDKLTEQVQTLTQERDAAQRRADRIEVSVLKSLDDDQARRITSAAKRLSGDTREELEADADEFLSAFSAAGNGGGGAPPDRQPRSDLRGGNDPTEDPVTSDDVRAAVEAIPRSL